MVAGIGRNAFERDDAVRDRILAGLDGTAEPEDNLARLFAQYAGQPGNDRLALAAVMRRDDGAPLTAAELATVTAPGAGRARRSRLRRAG